MAAVLKKRALAEYSQTIQEDPNYENKVKKLRLVKKIQPGNTTLALISCLESSKSSGDALRTLLRISDAFELDASDIPEAVRKLSDHFKIEAESAVRVKILSMLADLGLEPNTEHLTMGIIDEIMSLLRNDKSHKVLAQGMDSILRLGKSTTAASSTALGDVHGRLVAIARTYICNTNQRVRCKCLEMVGEFTPTAAAQVAAEGADLLHLVSAHFADADARVRAQALRTMGVWAGRGGRLDAGLYGPVVGALADDHEVVRQVALELLAALAIAYPETVIVLTNSEQELRMVDDAFGKICGAVTDLSPAVRALASRLLGGLTQVGASFLSQTLDKKLMSNMRRKRTAHELAWESVTSGEWASGRRWADDRPRELLDADSVSLMSSGACGAFVHGLEDEFLEVRSAAVHSICRLSQHSPDFANLSLDYLVDMLNDEIEDVRMIAIDSLRLIAAHIVLRDDQIETILGALEDFSQDVRERLHHMLACCHLSTTSALKRTVDKLLENLRRYPSDKRSTYRCLQRIGARHPELVLPLVPLLLAAHPYLDTTEPDVDNPQYVCQLLVVVNAAKYSVGVAPLLEAVHRRHYRYLRDTMPHLVPHLHLGDMGGETHNDSDKQGIAPPDAIRTLQTIVRSLGSGEASDSPLQARAQQQLARLAVMDAGIAGAAQFASRYIGARLLMTRLRPRTGAAVIALHAAHNTAQRIQRLLYECDSLQYAFVGHTELELYGLRLFRLRALAINLLHLLQENSSSSATSLNHFSKLALELQNDFTASTLEPDVFSMHIFRELNTMEEYKPNNMVAMLTTLLQQAPLPKIPQPNKDIKMSEAEIIEPSGRTDSSLKFTAGLIMAIPFEAELRHLADPRRLRLQVKYPDQRVQVVVPRPDHLKPLPFEGDGVESEATEPQRQRLLTTVLVSHQVWSEPCNIELSVAVAAPGVEGPRCGRVSNDASSTLINLCKPVRISLAPKPIKPLTINK